MNRTWPSSNLHSTSGDGGDGGNGGDKIYGVSYTAGVVQSLITNVDCGKYGIAGSCGRVLDAGEDLHGYSGLNGDDGTAGGFDDSYFLEFKDSFQ